MSKINLDKYYTPKNLAKYCVDKTREIIGVDNITEWLEPSAGSGVFLDYLDDKPFLAYDIEPEDSLNRIIKQDYLSLELEYKKGRCCIGNPPFGNKNTLSVRFYKKAIKQCEYIAFILPISQYKNTQQFFDYDLIYSEDFGKCFFVDRMIPCCFNIYKKPINQLNKKETIKLLDIEIIESRFGKKIPINYDLRLLAWGTAFNNRKLGCVLANDDKQYAKEFYIKINNEKHRNKIIDLLKNVDWTKEYAMTATPNLLQWQVYKYLKEKIPELK